MREVKLYIAATLDGFIAGKDGSLDWLNNHPNPNKSDYGYEAFFKTIDTVFMGRKTYEEILGFGVDWPYKNCKSYVVTTNKQLKPRTENTVIIHENFEIVVESLRKEKGKDIWLVGGGKLITSFLNAYYIDELILFIFPIILGSGIPLFSNSPSETNLTLVKSEKYETGVIGLTYIKKRK